MAQRSLGVLTLDIVAKTGNFTSGMDKAERASRKAADGIGRSTSTAARGVKALGSQSQESAKDVLRMGSALSKVAGPIAAFLSVQQIGQSAEQWTNINNRLKLVTESAGELAQAQSDVFRIAQDGRAPLAETAELYQRIATNAEELKLSGKGVADIVDTISKTMAISGASTAAQQAALVQLGQAFASGVLRGEEFNSVMEQAPALAKAIADGMGISVGQLRGLAQDGKLTADVVVEALQRQASAVDEQFSQIAPTISAALTVAENSFTRLVGTMDQSLGASSGVASGILSVSGAMNTLADNAGLVDKALTVALAAAGGKVTASLVAMVKQLQESAATSKLAASAAVQKAAAEEKSALATLAAVKAEQAKAIEMVRAANIEAATAKAQQALEVARLKTVQQSMAAEMALEQARHKAQISDIGRQQSVARMAELRTAELAITRQLTAAESLLAKQTAVSSAQITAALEARRIATINLAAAQGSVVAASAASSAAMAASATAGTLAASAMAKAAAGGRAILGVLGGPIGLIATIALSAAAFIDFGDNAEDGFDRAGAAAENAARRAKNLSGAILSSDLRVNVDTSSYDSITQAIQKVTSDLEAAEKSLRDIESEFTSDVPLMPGVDRKTQQDVTEATAKVEAYRITLNKLNQALSSGRFSGVGDANKYLDSLVKQNQQMQNLSEKEQAILKLRELSIDQNSEIGKKIIEQASANDALRVSLDNSNVATDESSQKIKKLADEYSSFLDGYEKQIALLDINTEKETLLYEIQRGRLVGINAEQQKRLIALAEEIDATNDLKKSQEQANKVRAFKDSSDDETESAKQAYRLQLAAIGLGKKQADQVRDRIQLEQEFERKKSALLSQRNSGDINEDVYQKETAILDSALAERLKMQREYYGQLEVAQSNWLNGATEALADYSDAARDIAGQTYSLVSGALEEMTQGFADAAAQSILWGQDFDSAMKAVGRSILENVLSSLIEIGTRYAVNAALEIAGVQAVAGAKMAAAGQVAGAEVAATTAIVATKKATQAAAIPAIVANASAASLQAGISAFASTAAIPIVGPAAAPAAMAAAIAATSPLVASISSLAIAGMAHDGMDSIPKTGTWLLEKGERVTTAKTSAKLDRTLADVQRNLDRMPAGNRQVIQNFKIETPNSDSFRMSERQIMRRARQRIS